MRFFSPLCWREAYGQHYVCFCVHLARNSTHFRGDHDDEEKHSPPPRGVLRGGIHDQFSGMLGDANDAGGRTNRTAT